MFKAPRPQDDKLSIGCRFQRGKESAARDSGGPEHAPADAPLAIHAASWIGAMRIHGTAPILSGLVAHRLGRKGLMRQAMWSGVADLFIERLDCPGCHERLKRPGEVLDALLKPRGPVALRELGE
jgi:hypothetical protein